MINNFNMRLISKGHKLKYPSNTYHKIEYADIKRIPCVKLFIESEINKYIQEKHIELLYKAMNRKDGLKYGEVGILINLTTKEQAIEYGEFHEFNPCENDDWTNILDRSSRRSCIVLHNHPNCSNFSGGDILSFLSREQYEALTAVGNDGRVHTLIKTQFFNDYSKIRELLQKRVDEIYSYYKGTKNIKQCRDIMAREVLKDSHKYGLEHSFSKRREL